MTLPVETGSPRESVSFMASPRATGISRLPLYGRAVTTP
jgi:hypothetical protein